MFLKMEKCIIYVLQNVGKIWQWKGVKSVGYLSKRNSFTLLSHKCQNKEKFDGFLKKRKNNFNTIFQRPLVFLGQSNH